MGVSESKKWIKVMDGCVNKNEWTKCWIWCESVWVSDKNCNGRMMIKGGSEVM